MRRLTLFAVAAVVLSFGAGTTAVDTGEASPAVGDLGNSTSLGITFTEGWFEREVTELGPRKCYKRCKKSCKRKYKRCKRRYGRAYCKAKKRKCKRRCRRRCRY